MKPERRQHNPKRRLPTRPVDVDKAEASRARGGRSKASVTELLILPDGRILVHSLTAAFAELLHELNPAEEQIRSRAGRLTQHAGRNTESHITPPTQ